MYRNQAKANGFVAPIRLNFVISYRCLPQIVSSGAHFVHGAVRLETSNRIRRGLAAKFRDDEWQLVNLENSINVDT